MSTSDATHFVLNALGWLYAGRALLAFRWSMRAANEAHALNLADIERLDLQGLLAFDALARFDAIQPFPLVMFNLTQWRYRSPFKLADLKQPEHA